VPCHRPVQALVRNDRVADLDRLDLRRDLPGGLTARVGVRTNLTPQWMIYTLPPIGLIHSLYSMGFVATDWKAAPPEFSLSENEIAIWRASLDCEAAALRNLEATLSPDEISRADRFHFPRDRARFVAGRGILRALLGAYLKREPPSLNFRYGPQGKPELEQNRGDSIHFNLSHKEGLGVYAFARQRHLGIDVEAIATDFPGEDIARRFFSPGELQELAGLSPDQRAKAFFLAWTRKEAYIKARGQGLHIKLDSFDVTLTPGGPARFLRGIAPEWQLFTFWAGVTNPGALACDGASPVVLRLFSWKA
jgi:4'-phosphopantetheinyl transferase